MKQEHQHHKTNEDEEPSAKNRSIRKKCTIKFFTESTELCSLYIIIQQRGHNFHIVLCASWIFQLHMMVKMIAKNIGRPSLANLWQKLLKTTLLCLPHVVTQRFTSDGTCLWFDLWHLGFCLFSFSDEQLIKNYVWELL